MGCDEHTETEGPVVTATTVEDAERAAIRVWNTWVFEHPNDRRKPS
jgi:hypothetical protein